MFTVSVMASNHLILCHPLLLLPSIFPSIREEWVSSSHQVAKGLELQLKNQSFQWIFRVDFLEEIKNRNSKKRNCDLDGIVFITSPIYTELSQMVKDLPAMRETWVRSLGWEDPLWREWLPTPVFLPEEFHGPRILVGYIVHRFTKIQTLLSK